MANGTEFTFVAAAKRLGLNGLRINPSSPQDTRTTEASMPDLSEEEVKAYAVKAHGDQKYGDQPYVTHLAHVVKVLKDSKFGEEKTLLWSAWLHDVVEDTDVGIEEISSRFGDEVADCVFRVSDEKGKNREERKLKTYKKIRGHRNATIVKLCDRIANVEASLPPKGRAHKLQMYQEEYPKFRSALYEAEICDDLWSKLDALLEHK